MQRGVGRLGGGKIAGLEGLAELREEAAEGILRVGGLGGLSVMMVVVMMLDGGGLLLKVLLNGGVIRLGGGEIAGLKISGQLLKRRAERRGSRSRLAGRGNGLRGRRHSGEIGLRLREIAGLEVLAELLEFLFKGLEIGFRGVRGQGLEEIAAGNSGNGHESDSFEVTGQRVCGAQCAPIQVRHRRREKKL